MDEPKLELRWWLLRTVPVHAGLGVLIGWAGGRWPVAVMWSLVGWHLAFAVLLGGLLHRWWPQREEWTAVLIINQLVTVVAFDLTT